MKSPEVSSPNPTARLRCRRWLFVAGGVSVVVGGVAVAAVLKSRGAIKDDSSPPKVLLPRLWTAGEGGVASAAGVASESGRRWTGSRWEHNGVPITYRVGWKSLDDGEEHSKEYSNIDHAWDYYNDLKKSARAYAVTYEHVTPGSAHELAAVAAAG